MDCFGDCRDGLHMLFIKACQVRAKTREGNFLLHKYAGWAVQRGVAVGITPAYTNAARNRKRFIIADIHNTHLRGRENTKVPGLHRTKAVFAGSRLI